MRIQDTRFVILDTETTGLDPEMDKVVELSLVEVSTRGIVPLFDAQINPQRDIPCTASAIHHITAKHVADKPTLEEVWPTVLTHLTGAVLVAHNAPFDRSMLPETGRPWLCSRRFAKHLWPEAPAYGNQVLRYWLDLDIDAERAHSAVGDTLVTAHIWERELAFYRGHVAQTDLVEDLIRYVNSPIPVTVMPFGKHKGEALSAIPLSYVQWALTNLSDLDPDLRASLEERMRVG